MDKGSLGHTYSMFCRQGSFKFYSEVDEILSDRSHFFPLLLIPTVNDQGGMEIPITDMAEDGNWEIVFIAYLLELPYRFRDFGHGNTKILHKGDKLRSPSYLRERRDKTLATRPH